MIVCGTICTYFKNQSHFYVCHCSSLYCKLCKTQTLIHTNRYVLYQASRSFPPSVPFTPQQTELYCSIAILQVLSAWLWPLCAKYSFFKQIFFFFTLMKGAALKADICPWHRGQHGSRSKLGSWQCQLTPRRLTAGPSCIWSGGTCGLIVLFVQLVPIQSFIMMNNCETGGSNNFQQNLLTRSPCCHSVQTNDSDLTVAFYW